MAASRRAITGRAEEQPSRTKPPPRAPVTPFRRTGSLPPRTFRDLDRGVIHQVPLEPLASEDHDGGQNTVSQDLLEHVTNELELQNFGGSTTIVLGWSPVDVPDPGRPAPTELALEPARPNPFGAGIRTAFSWGSR